MKASVLTEMRQIVEGQSDGVASIEMSANDLLNCVENNFWDGGGKCGGMIGSVVHPVGKALAAVDALEKLGFEKDSLKVLRAYFEHAKEAEVIYQKAARALGNLRDEFYDDQQRAKK